LPSTDCCCSPGQDAPVKPGDATRPGQDQPFVVGTVETPAGTVPVVSTELSRGDRMANFKTRLGIHRMDYRVDPGLYALGEPEADSPVLVSANYKLSFDHLRSSLPGRSFWILVLDTDGINVWCAAGKGTFGTEELIARVSSSGLARVVTHRTLIVPQLGAPGVAAHLVRRQSGFRVVYGPIRADDLPVFLDAGNKATSAMRKKTFALPERAVLIGVEMSIALKYAVLVVPALFFLSGLGWPGDTWANILAHGTLSVGAFLGAILAGAVVTPLLLPWLPGRAFSFKGMTAGLGLAAIHAAIWWPDSPHPSAFFEIGGWALFGSALAAFLAMNFTGASTYTSLSDVEKEMRWALPFEITGAAAGLILVVAARFL
jgi:hypothetical protein